MIVKNIEKKENNNAIFQVESDAAEFEAAVNAAYLKNKGSIYIPGFRKGKAPRAVVEGMYGAEAFYQDAMDELAPQAFTYAVESEKLRVVGAPSITDVNVTEARTVAYTFAVTLYPQVTLGEYKGIKAQRDAVTVDDAAIDTELANTQRRNARMLTVDDRAAQMGDTANIDFDGYLDGERFDGGKAEGYNLELGSNSFVPGFEEQIAGMKAGEEKDIDITFPTEYVEELAGKAVVFKVKLNSITVPELPTLDDEFAKDVSEFDTLDEYKADLRAKMEENLKNQAESKVRSDIIRQACDNMTVEVPDVMVNDKMEEIIRGYAANFGMSDRNTPIEKLMEMMGLDEETLNNSIRPTALYQVKSDMLLAAVVDSENITVTDEDTEEYAAKVAQDVQATVEQVKEYFGIDFIKEELKKERASAVIFDSAEITEGAAEEVKSEKKPAAKKTTKKAAEKTETAEETTSEKKPAAKKTAKKAEEKSEEAPAEKKPAAKKATKKVAEE